MKSMTGFIYLDKGYHIGVSEKIYSKVKNNNGIIVNLDEEGGVDFSDGSTIRRRYSKKLFESSDHTFLWGKEQYETIKNHIQDNQKIEITGHPRFELLKPEFHYLYINETQKIFEKYGTFILVNTNMSFGNNIKGDDFVIENYGERFKDIKRIISFDKEKLEAYRLLIIQLSEKLNLPIILRPHPEESHQFYLKAFYGNKNINIISKGSVIPWLLAAHKIIHPDCTTSIEALFLGKQSISFLPMNYPEDLVTELPLKASKTFDSVNEVIASLDIADEPIDLDDFPFADAYFSIKTASSKAIVERLIKIKNSNHENNTSSLFWIDEIYLRLMELRKKFRFGNKKKLADSKLNGFTMENIFKIHNLILTSTNDFNEISIKKISNGLFLFNIDKNDKS
jgi:surface carbohydrate biosynthesis protein